MDYPDGLGLNDSDPAQFGITLLTFSRGCGEDSVLDLVKGGKRDERTCVGLLDHLDIGTKRER